MRWKDWLEKWGMKGLKIQAGFLEMEWEPQDPDRDAAWDLYVELLTRVATQRLPAQHGDEQSALESMFKLFDVTRGILKARGRKCEAFAKLAIVVLNQVVRPFTAKWHRASLAGAFDDPVRCAEFRTELDALQDQLRRYTRMLADMAMVEDLTALDPNGV